MGGIKAAAFFQIIKGAGEKGTTPRYYMMLLLSLKLELIG